MKRFLICLAVMIAMVAPAHAQVWIWSQNATLNGNIDTSINWVEGMAPSSVNDSSRAEMGVIAKWRDDSSGLVALTGTSTAYLATTNQGNQGGLVSSLTPGYRLCFSPNVVNSTPVTLQVDGQAAKPLRSAPGVALVGGEMKIGTPYCATFFSSNGGEYILNNLYNVIVSAGAISTAQIANGAVTYAKIQNESNQTILGNDSGGAAAPQELTLGQGLGFSGSSILVPNLAITSGLIGNGAVGTSQLANSGVTYGKIQNESNATILGNNNGGAAAPSELTLGAGLGFSGSSVLVPAGGIGTNQLAAGAVTYAKIQNVNASRLLGNPTGGAASTSEISLGTGLSFSGSSLVGGLVSGSTVISGGSSGQCLWNSSGTMTTQACARLDVADQTVTGGANVTTLSLATGNVTIDCGSRPLQSQTNGGAYTITAPSNDGSCILGVANNATAGAITFSGFNVGANTGDALDTVNGHNFMITIVRISGVSTYMIKALQ